VNTFATSDVQSPHQELATFFGTILDVDVALLDYVIRETIYCTIDSDLVLALKILIVFYVGPSIDNQDLAVYSSIENQDFVIRPSIHNQGFVICP
jgi:hypothetical protein